jgi:hypothetical protein
MYVDLLQQLDTETISFNQTGTRLLGLFMVFVMYGVALGLKPHFFRSVLNRPRSLFMVSEVPMFSLKFKNLKWADNKIRYIFLIVSLVILLLLWKEGLSAVICWYIILSILTKGHQ